MVGHAVDHKKGKQVAATYVLHNVVYIPTHGKSTRVTRSIIYGVHESSFYVCGLLLSQAYNISCASPDCIPSPLFVGRTAAVWFEPHT